MMAGGEAGTPAPCPLPFLPLVITFLHHQGNPPGAINTEAWLAVKYQKAYRANLVFSLEQPGEHQVPPYSSTPLRCELG